MSTISAGTTLTTALISAGDTTGDLQLQVNGTTPSLTLKADGSIGLGATPTYGTAGQVLTSGGPGAAPTWAAGVSPAGSTGQVQYNNGGAFGALSDGTTGQVLTSAGAGFTPIWTTVDALPSQTGNTGKFLTTNGATASWADMISIEGPTDTNLPLGVASQFIITNFDSYTTYTLSTTNGTVTRSEEIIYYTPSAVGAAGFTINGRVISGYTGVVPPGQQEYTSSGTYSWIAPAGVTSVSVVCVGGGCGGGIAGGAGAGVAYLNNISVTPGNSYTVVVGAGGSGTTGNAIDGLPGGSSSFAGLMTATGGGPQTSFGTFSGAGVLGYNGGRGAGWSGLCGFGGAAGNNANGSDAISNGGSAGGAAAPNGVIGGPGGGAGGSNSAGSGGGGGGSGLGYIGSSSNGQNGPGSSGGAGGAYGGGGGGAFATATYFGGQGGSGAVRIIWGDGRAFPNTNTGNL